jgi:hypothetical protein
MGRDHQGRPDQPAMKKPIKTLKRLLKILENPNSRLFVGSVSASVFIGQESKSVAWPVKTAKRAVELGQVVEVGVRLRKYPQIGWYKGIPY